MFRVNIWLRFESKNPSYWGLSYRDDSPESDCLVQLPLAEVNTGQDVFNADPLKMFLRSFGMALRKSCFSDSLRGAIAKRSALKTF